MRQNKKSKIILILIIILIIIIIMSGLAIIYISTDLFKSNKQLFFKYVAQIGNAQEGFIENSVKEYFEKIGNTPYKDEGNISINIKTSKGQEQFKNTNNMNLTFKGQVDSSNSQIQQDLSLNYSDRVKFPVSLRKIKDTIGLQTQYIGSKYVVINQEETEEDVSDNMQIDLDSLNQINNIDISQEDIQHLKETYTKILNEQLKDSYFSKIEENNQLGYKITLSGENIKNIIINLLETLKNDQTTLDKINEYYENQDSSSTITSNDIDNYINTISNNSDIDDETIEITIYQKENKISSLIIKTQEIEINLEKVVTGNDIQYTLQFKGNTGNEQTTIGLIAKYAGLQSMQSITENYELTFEQEDLKYQYNYNNNIEFTDKVDISPFNEENALLLDDMETETKNNFIDAVTQRIQSVNKEQMEQLGLEESENPLRYVIPPVITDMLSPQLPVEEMEATAISSFNAKFEMYAGSNLKGVTVKGLLSIIQINNEAEDTKKIEEIHFDGQEFEVTEQNITLIKSSIESDTEYKVEFEKDENTGLIYRAVINKK